MDSLKEQMFEINQIFHENDSIYHDIALSCGIPDKLYWILYILYYSDAPISQSELCSEWFYSKQTVNSTVSAMVRKGWAILETVPGTRNRKNIVLTESGREFCTRVIGETQEIERAAFSRIADEDRRLFLSLFRTYNQYMREEFGRRQANRLSGEKK